LGGAEHQLARLVQNLDRGRFEPAVICLSPSRNGGGAALEDLPADVPVRALSLAAEGRGRLVRRLTRVLLLARELASWRPEIVHGYLPGGYIMAALARPPIRAPLIVATRMTISPIDDYRGASLRRIARPVNRIIDFHICDSEAARSVMLSSERVDAAKTAVIHTGTDLPDLTSGRPALPDGWDVNDPAMAAASLANLRWQKGHLVLMHAVRRVVDVHPGFKLILIGEGPQRPAIEALARELGLSANVVLGGPRKQGADLLGAFHFSVLASVEESFPNALIESMAAAVPIVATRVGGIPELVRDGVDGLLVPPKEPGALAHAMLELLSDPQLRDRMGASARARVESSFTTESMVRQIETLYVRLLRNRLPQQPADQPAGRAGRSLR
jgi:glycosyltransferase involved in cell wall biosynthesis